MSLFIPAKAYVFYSQFAAATMPLYEIKKHFLVLFSVVLNYLINPSIEAVTQFNGTDFDKLMDPWLTAVDVFNVMVIA